MEGENPVFVVSQPYTPLPLFLPDNAMRAGVTCLLPAALIFKGAEWDTLGPNVRQALSDGIFAWACQEGLKSIIMDDGIFSKFATVEGIRVGLVTGSDVVDDAAPDGIPPYVWPILNGLQLTGGLQQLDPDLNLAMGTARDEEFADRLVLLTLEIVGYDAEGAAGMTSELSDEALEAFLAGEDPTR